MFPRREDGSMEPSRSPEDASGWSTLAKTIRGVDKSKVQDHKEDIDTLLVFAGLFSAVMTAFFVQSYPALQEDPADTTVALLRQVLLKMDKGVSLSSVDPQSTANTPFEPSTAVIVVNILWFASLLLSLICASIGMLVKQWLREYLAVNCTVPQVQLRIRHFRNPSLAAWKVFEIAAILPLLLQLSLGLFFLGICLFAWSIHPALGKTGIPIVAVWACFLVFTTLAPAFSARCPYKTPFLQSSMKLLRRYNHRMLHCACRALTRFIHFAAYISARLPVRRTRTQDVRNITLSLQTEPTWLPSFLHSKWDLIEEEDAALQDGHAKDIDVLVAVDAILSDDDLLCTDIVEGALQSPHAIDWIRFLRRIISNRLQRTFLFDSSRLPPDLADLPWSTYESLAQVIERIVGRALNKLRDEKTDSNPWLRQCLEQSFILLLHSSANRFYPLPEVAIRIVQSFISSNPVQACRFLGCAFFHLDDPSSRMLFREISDRLPLFLSHLDGRTAFSYLEQIIAWRIFSAGNDHSDSALPVDQISIISHRSWIPAMTQETYRRLIWVASGILKQEIDCISRGTSKWSHWLTEVLRTYLDMEQELNMVSDDPTGISRSTAPCEWAFTRLLISQESTAVLLDCLSKNEASTLQLLLSQVNRDMTDQRPHTVSAEALHYICNFLRDMDCPPSSPKPMRLCFLAMHMSLVDPDVLGKLELYRLLFTNIEPILYSIRARQPSEEERTLARQCLWRLHTAEIGLNHVEDRRPSQATVTSICSDDTAYHAWVASFDPNESIYQDSFVQSLHEISGDRNSDKFRVRRLVEAKPSHDTRSSAKGTITSGGV